MLIGQAQCAILRFRGSWRRHPYYGTDGTEVSRMYPMHLLPMEVLVLPALPSSRGRNDGVAESPPYNPFSLQQHITFATTPSPHHRLRKINQHASISSCRSPRHNSWLAPLPHCLDCGMHAELLAERVRQRVRQRLRQRLRQRVSHRY
jgi:hypothetical protein